MLRESKMYNQDDIEFIIDRHHELTKDKIISEQDHLIIKATLIEQLEVRNRSAAAVKRFSDGEAVTLSKRSRQSQGSCDSLPAKQARQPTKSNDTRSINKMTNVYKLTNSPVKTTHLEPKRATSAAKNKVHAQKLTKATKAERANMPAGDSLLENSKHSSFSQEPALEEIVKPCFLEMFEIAEEVAVVSNNKEAERHLIYSFR
jgi:hypothetical protein